MNATHEHHFFTLSVFRSCDFSDTSERATSLEAIIERITNSKGLMGGIDLS